MRRPRLALIHSPLVGPMTWQATAEALRSLGYPRVETPSACAWDVGPPYYEALTCRIAADLDAEPWLLVGHSAAGGLLPAIAEALPGETGGMVFVDAVLPYPGRTWLDTAPPVLSSWLRERAIDGRAPPWPEWFPPSVLAGLLPDAGVRAAFSGEARPIAMRYLTEPAPATRVPAPTRCAYLQLSAGYDAEADAALMAGWTLQRLPLHHLAMLTDPDRVAGMLHSLIEAVSVPSES